MGLLAVLRLAELGGVAFVWLGGETGSFHICGKHRWLIAERAELWGTLKWLPGCLLTTLIHLWRILAFCCASLWHICMFCQCWHAKGCLISLPSLLTVYAQSPGYCWSWNDAFSCFALYEAVICEWFVTCLSDLEVLRSFQNQIAAIQRDAVWWLHTVVPSISKLAPKDYVHW